MQEGCRAVSPSLATQARISSSVSTDGAGRDLPAVEGGQGGLVEQLARDADRLDPLAAVLFGGQVVEAQRRVFLRVPAPDLHRAEGVGVHGAHVHLVPVSAGGHRAVVADRDRQEVEHQVGVVDVIVAAREAARLEVIGRRGALAEEPLQPDEGGAPFREIRLHGDGLLAGVLDVHLQVVLQVLADARQVVDDVDAERAQLLGVADAGELEQLRGVDGAAAEDDLLGAHLLERPAAAPVLDADSLPALEEDAGDEGARGDGEVGTLPDGLQVGLGGGEPASAVDVAVELGEAFLPVAVDVLGGRVAGLLGGLLEGGEERVGGRAALQDERAVVAAELVVRVGREAVLHALEVRQAVRVVPGLHAGIGGPALVVHGVAALEDHAVDAAGAAQHLAAGVVDAPAAHVGLGLGLVLPVVETAADRIGQRRGHVDEDVPRVVGPPCLQDQHPVSRVGGEPVGQCAAGRSTADDDEVVLLRSHGASSRSRRRYARHASTSSVIRTRLRSAQLARHMHRVRETYFRPCCLPAV
ncbi:hypothetical protein M2156_007399 [Streptomyces sp. SAI-149]|nr:hypothetical protein [Streptomyces sp. SAI-149]